MQTDRRDFLKTIAAASFIPSASAAEAGPVPTCESLSSVGMVHRFGDLFNPPALTNFLGCAQAAQDITGIRSVAFPPFAEGEMSADALGGRGDLIGSAFLDGEYLVALRDAVEFIWRPDRIERKCTSRELQLHSTTIVPPDCQGAAVQLEVTNTGPQRRDLELKLLIQGGVTRRDAPWGSINPGEVDNRATIAQDKCAVIFEAQQSRAASAVAAWPRPSSLERAAIRYRIQLAPGDRFTLTFSNTIGETASEVVGQALDLARNFDSHAQRSTEQWNSTLRAAFTPGNSLFSGYLPTLATSDGAMARLYQTAVTTLLFHRRTTPASIYGTTYVTLAPRYWETTTFLWDISLSSTMLALLDPKVLRRMVETWMKLDIWKHFGTEFLKGEGVGPWYSVNDFAMCRMARDYLRWTGDFAWLDQHVDGVAVIDRIVQYANHWRSLDVNGHGLADYGGVNNLLEAVSSYVHEVAGLNAANVFCLRFVADLLEHRGERGRAQSLRTDAAALAGRVLELYVPREGVWNCRLPDGRMQTVRHCYDFATVLSTIPGDLSATQKAEMVNFFRSELQTPAWMHALSARDGDVIFSVRPDHQWTGAYAAWPAISLTALYNANEDRLAQQWMHGLARTALQGPIAQAHFAETAIDAEAGGGARKAPSDMPWICDWSCVAGGAFLEPILHGLFGIDAPLFGELTAKPRFAGFGSSAQLRGLRYQGRDYTITGRGATRGTARGSA